jgi:hypothetical protein
VDKTSSPHGCWLWTGATALNGYGSLRGPARATIYAHRAAYIIAYGAIPEGAMLCHSCDIRQCVRPDHLRPGDHRQNAQDALIRERLVGRRTWSGSICSLTAVDVLAIRAACASGPIGTQRAMALRYGVAETTISAIVKRQTWAHITD